METFSELEAVYRRRIRDFGLGSELLFYKNSEQHVKKLKSFARILSEVEGIQDLSLLEVGCGYGALLEVFKPGPRYLGIDLMPEFIAEARRRYPEYEFQVGNVLDASDLSCDIGVLAGVLSSVPEPTRMLQHVMLSAKLGVLFDVTLQGRLPLDFTDLNRWTLDQVLGVTCECGYGEVVFSDSTASWVLGFARRRAEHGMQG